MLKVGLFFGSFDPIHNGHLTILKTTLQKLNLEKMRLVLTPQNPFKPNQNLTSFGHRLKMLRLAIDNLKSDSFPITLDTIELSLPNPNYTVITLMKMKQCYPDERFYFILGRDSFASLDQWEGFQWIVKNVCLVIYDRHKKNKFFPLKKSNNNIIDTSYSKIFCDLHNREKKKFTNSDKNIFLDKNIFPLIHISSTIIRKRRLKNKKIDHLLPTKVNQYILNNALYQTQKTISKKVSKNDQ